MIRLYKFCPYCGERINHNGERCRYCRRILYKEDAACRERHSYGDRYARRYDDRTDDCRCSCDEHDCYDDRPRPRDYHFERREYNRSLSGFEIGAILLICALAVVSFTILVHC